MIEIKVRFCWGSVCTRNLLGPSCVLIWEENDSPLFLKFWSNLFLSIPHPDAGIHTALYIPHAGCYSEFSLWSSEEDLLIESIGFQSIQVWWPCSRVRIYSHALRNFSGFLPPCYLKNTLFLGLFGHCESFRDVFPTTRELLCQTLRKIHTCEEKVVQNVYIYIYIYTLLPTLL